MIVPVFSWWREAGERLRDLIFWPLQIVLKDLLFLAHRSESQSSQSSSCVCRYITSSLFAAFHSVEWGLFLLSCPRLDFLWETQQSPLLDSSTPIMNKKGCLRLKIFQPCKLLLANTFHLTFLLVGQLNLRRCFLDWRVASPLSCSTHCIWASNSSFHTAPNFPGSSFSPHA